MRIIAGTARSLPLKTPDGLDTRPTSDRIKETLFNILQQDVEGAYFLDLFAGSGQMGLEAVSRGARYAVFVDKDKKPAACIADNISFTKFDKQCQLVTSDVLTAIHTLDGKYKFDIIFMDPPYDKELEKEALYQISKSGLLKEDAIIVVEASLNTEFDYLDEIGFELTREKIYKTSKHVFIKKGA